MSLRYGKPRFRPEKGKWELPVYEGSKRKRPLFDSKREALNWATGLSVEKPNSSAIDEAIQVYFRDVSAGKSRTSCKNEKRYFNLMFHFFVEERGLESLSQVRYGDCLALQNWLGEERIYDGKPMHWGATTINRAFNSIKDFFVYWVRNGEIESSPCAHLAQLRAAENTRRPMSGEEFAAAFKKAPGWFRPTMAFMHLTAAAPSSVERLSWNDVESDNGLVIITRCKGAGGKWRRNPFPLTGELAALFAALPREKHGFVFSNESGEPLRAAWISRMGNRVIRAAKLKGVVLYSLRHALASELSDANVNQEVIRQLMGHANIRTTQRYSKPKTESLARALTLVRGENCHQTATCEVSETKQAAAT